MVTSPLSKRRLYTVSAGTPWTAKVRRGKRLSDAPAAASPAGSEALTAGDDAKNWQDLATAAFASQMGGLRKDSYAVAQRIAGLEEEQGKSVERVAELDGY